MNIKELLEKDDFLKPPKLGDIVEGKIINREGSSIFLDLGALGTGIIYGREFFEAKEILKDLKIDESIFAKIIDLENEDGYIELSVSSASKELAWGNLRQKHAAGEIIPVKILGANKGGLIAQLSGIPAFLPVSQLSSEHYPRVEEADKLKILTALQKFIGQELEVKIFDIDPQREKLILSERAKESDKLKTVLKNFKVGDEVEGEITAISNFGAFMRFSLPADLSSEARRAKEETSAKEGLPADLSADSSAVALAKTEALAKEEALLARRSSGEGGAKEKAPAKEKPAQESLENIPQLEGLIHISELDWSIVENPADIVKVGEKVKAKIIEISSGRISLSLKALKKDPWQDLEKEYKKGDVVKGKVTKFNPFGAFVQISPKAELGSTKIQGLCHISEFRTKAKMEEKLKIGEDYNFQILSIEPKEHRMSLKIVE